MQQALYYLALPFIYFLSFLPFKIIYIVSDCLYLLLFYVVKYRRTTVRKNLRNSFPKKSGPQIFVLEKAYYRYMCDLIFEAVKKITMTENQTRQRCTFLNVKLLEELYSTQKSIILLMGHYGNWEWAGSSFSLSTNYQLHVIYKPLSNPYFESLMCKTRTLFGTRLIKVNNTLKDIIANKNNQAAYAFIADQTPAPEYGYWRDFLHQDTPIFTGAEKIARKFSFPVVFINVKRIRRGYYQISADLISDDPKSAPENAITDQFVDMLETEINKDPTTWLWSHKRWKHVRPASYVSSTSHSRQA